MTTTPPGWYDDGHGALRWWDGTQWTEHVAQPDAESSPAPTEAEIVAAQLGFEQQQPVAAGSGAAQPEAGAVPAVSGEAGAPGQQAYPATQQYPPAGQAYPQGAYPGAPVGGGFTAATEPRKSKLWILWVVLGVVLLGIVIAAAVVIPLLLLSASSATGGAGTDEERAAVAAVELYDEAWQNGDCDALTGATTEEFRIENGFTDCATFEEQAAAFNAGLEEYDIRVTDVETVGDEVVVATEETYTEISDEADGGSAPGSAVYEYTVVDSGDDWRIDSVATE